MSLKILLSVAAGGAVGAVGRYLIMSQVGHWFGAGFPFATLAVNVLGSFILGSLVEIMALVWSPSEEIRAMLVVGLLGALTTFSTFSMDIYFLMERGEAWSAGLYVAASVLLCVLAFYGGLHLLRHILV